MTNQSDIVIQNKPGTYYLGNVIMTITKDQIRIVPNQQAIQQYQQQQQVGQFQGQGHQVPIQPENTADRLQKSTLKTVDFFNKFFWG